MVKRALISVYDKTQIIDFSKRLIGLGWEIISTGGTERLLKESNLDVISIDEVTEFPEILGGRVKTLHPKIHGGILNRRDNENDQEEIAGLNIESIDMVVNNLYPFEKTVLNPEASRQEIIENIDIGGPSMIRAAAKNYKDVIIITDIADYDRVLNSLEDNSLDENKRKKLAAKAFGLTAFYDSMISEYFNKELQVEYPEYLIKGYRYEEELRYGENPHQKAVFYSHPLENQYQMQQLHGKPLSYNNYNDIKAAVDLVREFDKPAAVAVKHANPCGAAVGNNIFEAYSKAYETDEISIFGGIVALNREVDEKTAQKMNEIFLEIIVAPGFSEQASALLTQKKNLRLIEMPQTAEKIKDGNSLRQSLDGMLIQEKDNQTYNENQLELKTKRRITDQERKDLDFAWSVAKHINSNGIVVAKDGATLGLGHGEVRRVWALEQALERAEKDLQGAVIASDGFFFEDTIATMHEYGLQAIIQPGGSVQDQKVIDSADKKDISVLFTGMRHFKH
ncbi:MAG: bifunctional phosphoribosylaminoimidazolecarboxamide formyltransferase/IMP cyclohydrolase [Atopococcus tabaci]|uniref:Bifunctional purine biosynthesis protein PurH n=1 Tax=Atopococcus tabaci TaxID=269774 RepID=A0AA43ZS19_9LACT|nr:bifunctional phosphoribosylaminoimidazolecarboxamide formyltransferase/IMP cyclohydrolase [Atopococcus tabaci]